MKINTKLSSRRQWARTFISLPPSRPSTKITYTQSAAIELSAGKSAVGATSSLWVERTVMHGERQRESEREVSVKRCWDTVDVCVAAMQIWFCRQPVFFYVQLVIVFNEYFVQRILLLFSYSFFAVRRTKRNWWKCTNETQVTTPSWFHGDNGTVIQNDT